MIRFREHNITYNKKIIKILVPEPMVEQLWVIPDSFDYTYWDGNREAFKCLKEASKIMGHQNNIIIYFPLRQSKYYYYWDDSGIWYKDMVWMGTHVNLALADWKEIRKKIEKDKTVKYYDNNWNDNKTISIFEYNVKQMENKDYPYDRCPMERVFNTTVFYRLPQFFYQKAHLDLIEYLKDNLEQDYMDAFLGLSKLEKFAVPNTWLHGILTYRHETFTWTVELGFHDVNLAKRKKLMIENKEKEKRGEKLVNSSQFRKRS